MYVQTMNPYGMASLSGISQNIPTSFNYGFAPTGAGTWQGLTNATGVGAWQGLTNTGLGTMNTGLMGISPMTGFQSSINPAATAFQSAYNPTLNWGGLATQGAFVSTGLTQPRVDLSETNSDVVVAAELPNINPNNLSLTVTDDSITISASTIGIGGISGTSIYRTVSLPTDVRAEHCSASYNNGILEVRCPKADLSTRRRIQVTS
jgi:HSP20 family molecular chaperone IbpA